MDLTLKITNPSMVILGSSFLILALFCRTVLLNGRDKWIQANEMIEPSLDAHPPPTHTAYFGCIGLMYWNIGRVFLFLFSVLSADQFLNNGEFLKWSWAFLLGCTGLSGLC